MRVEPQSLERIERVRDGHYLACYTLRSGQGFTGYAKLFAFEPDSVWDERGAYGKVAAGPLPTPHDALDAVIRRAVLVVTTA